MMANQWFRLWHDMPNDPKWRTIARASDQPIAAVIGVYLHILTNASNAGERGRLEKLSCEDIASALDLEGSQVEAILEAMQGRVLQGDAVSGWQRRQPIREDGSAERARNWRAARKTQGVLLTSNQETARTRTPADEHPKTDDTKLCPAPPDRERERRTQNEDLGTVQSEQANDTVDCEERSSEKSLERGDVDSETEYAIRDVIAYLNAKACKNFEPVEANLQLVRARLHDGATLEQLKAVIDSKAASWRADPTMQEYLRPETLFNARKFAQYVGESLSRSGEERTSWWRKAGFERECQATNAGCTEATAHLWHEGNLILTLSGIAQ